MGCKSGNSVSIGDMRHRVELQNFATAKNDFNEDIRSWTTYATVWAAIKYVSGTESENADQISGISTHKIMIRYDSRVDVTDRIFFDSRYFEIAAPPQDPSEMKEFLILTCKEVQ